MQVGVDTLIQADAQAGWDIVSDLDRSGEVLEAIQKIELVDASHPRAARRACR